MVTRTYTQLPWSSQFVTVSSQSNKESPQYPYYDTVRGNTVLSQTQFGSAPHPPLRIESDSVSRSHSYPLWDGAVLPLLLGQKSLDFEALMGGHTCFFVRTRSRGGVKSAHAHAHCPD